MKKITFIILFIFLLAGTVLAADIDQLTKAAQNGDLAAANTLGQMYLSGEGVERDVFTGRQWLQKAAENNDSEAQYILGKTYYLETVENLRSGLPDKSEKALYWLAKAFKNGMLDAGFYIGDIYFKSGNTKQDYDKAKQFWEAAAQAGNSDAKSSLRNFDDNVAEKANLKNLMQQANNGDVLAAKKIAYMFLHSQIVFPNEKEYLRWLQKTAELGDMDTQFLLAGCYESASMGLPMDFKKALYWYQAAAAQENQRAQFRLLMIQLNGELGVTPNPKEAAKKIIDLAEEGFINAQMLLVNMYLTGNGVTQNYQQAVEWLIKLTEHKNNGWMATKLGDLYLNGVGIKQNYELAMQYYLKAASFFDDNRSGLENSYKLAEMHMKGLGVEQNYTEAMYLYLKAEKDNFEFGLKSKARLWEFYYYGLSGRTDYIKAFKLAEELADKDKPEGYYSLALAYYEGKSTDVNNTKALMWLKKLFEAKDVPLIIMDKANILASLVLDRATSGEKKAADWDENLTIDKFSKFNFEALLNKVKLKDTVAQFELAKRYYEGAGVEQNYAEAINWYTKAAENNNAKAQYALGKIYYEGIATLINHKKTLYWYLKAAEANLPEAQFALAWLYKTGKGTAIDLQASFKWMLKAAENDLAKAQNSVAKMYFYGIGTKVNRVQGYVWMAKAYENLKNQEKNITRFKRNWNFFYLLK